MAASQPTSAAWANTNSSPSSAKEAWEAVYKAQQTRLKKIVALKVLPKERTTDPRAVARFEREMEAVGQLAHPNIVQAYDAREIEGTNVLVMEYVDGKDLAQVVECVGPLRISDACELVRQTAIGTAICPRVRPDPPRHQALEPDAGMSPFSLRERG